MFFNKFAGEAVGPESFWSLAEGNLQLDLFWLVAILLKETKSVFKNLTTVNRKL